MKKTSHMHCGLTKSENKERERLLELQKNSRRWFSREELDRIKELSNKMFVNTGSPQHPLAEIDFIPLDENVRIIELRNFKALQEIEKQYGKKVKDEYANGDKAYMYKFVNLVVICSGFFRESVSEDSILSKPEFETLIPIMKKAGKRLHRIVQKYKKMRTVEI